MTKLFLILGFLIFSFGLFSQTITLTNGHKEVRISPNNHIKTSLGINLSDCDNDCDGVYLIGNLYKVEKDSLTMQISEYQSFASIGGVNLRPHIYSGDNLNTYKFAKTDISNIEFFKSKSMEKRKSNFVILGGMLAVTGLTTGLNSLFVSGKNNRKNLLIAGGAQLALGISFGISSSSKNFKFRKAKNGKNWRIK